MEKKLLKKSCLFLAILLVGMLGTRAQSVLFSENFDNFTASPSTNISDNLDTYTSQSGWTGARVYSYSGKAKIGASNSTTGQGWIQTPSINLSGNNGNFTLEFDITAWVNDSTYIRVYVDNTCYVVENLDNTNDYDNLAHITLPMTGGTSSSHIKFEGALNGKGRFFLDNLVITQSGGTQTVATPVFSHSSGIHVAPFDLTLTCETAGSSIYYTTDGTTPTDASTLYTAPIAISQTTTVKAIAVAAGYSNSLVASATYTFPPTVSDIAAFKTQTSDQMLTISNDVTYVFGQGAYTYVKDASAGLLIYGNNAVTGFSEGDQISNLTGKKSIYSDQIEMTSTVAPAPASSNTGAVAPTVVTISDLLTNYSSFDAQLVTIENVNFPDGFSGSTIKFGQGTDSLTLYNRFGVDTVLAAGTTTNITGFAAIHTSNSGTSIQIYPRYNSDLSSQAPVLLPSLTITAPANGSEFSTLDTLPISIDIQNFTLGTDGYLKVESPLLTTIGLSNPAYLNQISLAVLQQAVLSPLPAGTHTITCSLVDMDHVALNPAVSAMTTFTVVAPQLAEPIIQVEGMAGEEFGTYYFNATISITAEAGASIRYTTDNSEPTEASTLYTGPFQITTTSTIKAIAVKANYQNSNVAYEYVIVTAPTVPTPEFDPTPGTHGGPVTVTITCDTYEEVDIRYTLDGNEPTESSALYILPFTLDSTTTVKAKAFKANWLPSETATAVYTIVFDPTLAISETTLNFTSTQLSQTFTVSGAHLDNAVTMTCSDPHFTLTPATITNPNSNTVVTVTFDGTEPATGFITVVSDTLSAQVALTATAQLPAPVLTPATAIDTMVTVTMSCTVADAAIHYTTDGSVPTSTSTLYNAPIVLNVPGNYTVKAIAMKTDWENSEVTTGTYVINEPPAPDTVNVPVITPATDTYYAPQTVTITCADADAVIRYTVDGTEPTEASTLYSAPFTVTTNTTVTAKAWKAGMVPSGTASVTISFPVQVANIAAFKAEAATNQERQIMSDVTFVFRSGRFMFVEDNTGAMLIYDYNTPVITTQYNEGDVIEGGIFGKYTTYQGMVEMLPTHNANAATGTPVTVTPANATITDIKTQYTDVYEAKLVHLSDVEFISSTQFVQNGDTMAIFNRFNTVDLTISAGDLADVTGFVSYSTNHGYQIYPRDNNDIDIHPVVVLDTVATPVFDVYRDGEFYRVHLDCATDGASIYYTFDGTDPDENTNLFTTDFPLNLQPYTLKAVAMKEGMVNSAIAVYNYNPSGIVSYELKDNISVYPNPAIDNVTISVKDGSATIEKVELYNIYGQLLNTMKVNGNVVEIAVDALATGTYFAKVFTDKGVATMPVIRK
jgi:hypothetical protein